MLLAAPGAAQDYDIDWWSVDGGFRPVTADGTDRLFTDGLES